MSAGELILTDCLKDCSWALQEMQTSPMSRSGGAPVVSFGRPFWTLRARYENLSEDAFRQLTAWISRRQRSRYSFTAWRPDRPTTALNSSITNSGLGVSSVSIGGGTVGLTGLGTNVISPGDMIGYSTLAGGYWVGEALATATPTAGAATVSVWPYPQTPHGTPNVRLLKALGEFQIDTTPDVTENADRTRSVSFTATQVIRV